MGKMKRSKKLEFVVASALTSVLDMVELGFCNDCEIAEMVFDVVYAYMSHIVKINPTNYDLGKLKRDIQIEIEKQIDNVSWDDILCKWLKIVEHKIEGKC